VASPRRKAAEVQKGRSAKLYRSLGRTLRVYNRLLVEHLQARGFDDFSPAFPPLLSNLDADGTRIGVLASRVGVTRQAAGQLLREIERCGYVKRWDSPTDARATVIAFTPRGKRLLATVLDLVEQIEEDFAAMLGPGEFDRACEALSQIADRIDPGGTPDAGSHPRRDERAGR
jgi:DNA-binding MarR family transcriptional regulator